MLPSKNSLHQTLTDSLYIEEKTSNLFMSALQQCRIPQNRTVCKYNDRGNKVSYFQVFEYDLNKIVDVVSRFKEYDSAYKNYCLYVAINKMYNAETMLLETLRGICERRYDVFEDESECWAGAMCALKIIDFYYLTNALSSDTASVIRLCLLLLNIYIKYHFDEDQLRAMECYANRSRLNERLFLSDHYLFIAAVSAYSERIETNMILTKHLCIYDLEQAKRLAPHEFAENYHFFASQLMMYQNQGLGKVLPDGDAFDSSFNEVIAIGESIAEEINYNLEDRIQPVFDEFISKYNISLIGLREVVNSYYQRMNESHDDKLTNFCCFSWAYQLESYSHFGMIKAEFTPVKYHLKDFLQSLQIDRDKVEVSNNCGDDKKYLIHNFDKMPNMRHAHYDYSYECPFIMQLLILTDGENNIKAFRCYGQNFKNWIKELRRYHIFFGIPVSPFGEELYHLPEVVNLMVCFQIENDINIY